MTALWDTMLSNESNCTLYKHAVSKFTQVLYISVILRYLYLTWVFPFYVTSHILLHFYISDGNIALFTPLDLFGFNVTIITIYFSDFILKKHMRSLKITPDVPRFFGLWPLTEKRCLISKLLGWFCFNKCSGPKKQKWSNISQKSKD